MHARFVVGIPMLPAVKRMEEIQFDKKGKGKNLSTSGTKLEMDQLCECKMFKNLAAPFPYTFTLLTFQTFGFQYFLNPQIAFRKRNDSIAIVKSQWCHACERSSSPFSFC
mmetsp:Transcript_1846/g.2677  ORF Transcript_1846/g.2677 Transcript_1846/m.2677 type:complete len:110 (+) Transcript_1846:696-1025(+)